MKQLTIYVLLAISFLCIGCTKDDDNFPKPDCLITAYGKIVAVSDPTEILGYSNRIKYSGAKVLIREGNPNYDSIIYDKYNRVHKIYHFPVHLFDDIDYYSYSDFEYANSKSTLPIVRNENHIYRDELRYTYNENILYNTDKKISKTEILFEVPVGTFPGNLELITNYEYNEIGNLTKISTRQVSNAGGDNLIETTTTLSEYDKGKNPFNNLPLLDLRGISDSENNYKIIETSVFRNGVYQSAYRSSTGDYEFNEFGYPEIGIYDCK